MGWVKYVRMEGGKVVWFLICNGWKDDYRELAVGSWFEGDVEVWKSEGFCGNL